MAKETFMSLTAKHLPKLVPLLKQVKKNTADWSKEAFKSATASDKLTKSIDKQSKAVKELNQDQKLKIELEQRNRRATLANAKANTIAAKSIKARSSRLVELTQKTKSYTNAIKKLNHHSSINDWNGIAGKTATKTTRKRLNMSAAVGNKRRTKSTFTDAPRPSTIEDLELPPPAKIAKTIGLFQRLVRVQRRVGNGFRSFGRIIRKTTTFVFRLARATAKALLPLDAFSGAILKMKLYGSMMSGVGKGFGLLNDSMNLAGTRQQMQQFFKLQLRGDGAGADQLLGDITSFSSKSPFTITQSRGFYGKLLQVMNGSGMALGTKSDRFGNLTELVRMFGDAAGGDTTRMSRIVVTMSQMLSRGKGNELDFRELANSLVDLKPILRKIMGLGKGQEFEASKVDRAMMLQAFKMYTTGDGPMAGSMAASMNTWPGILSNLKDMIITFKEEVGRPMVATFGPILRSFRDAFNTPEMKKSFRLFGRWMAQTGLTFTRVIKSLFGGGKFGGFLPGLGKSINMIALYFEDFLKLIRGQDSAIGKATGFGETWKSVLKFFNTAWVWMQKLVTVGPWKMFTDMMKGIIKDFWEKGKEFVKTLFFDISTGLFGIREPMPDAEGMKKFEKMTPTQLMDYMHREDMQENHELGNKLQEIYNRKTNDGMGFLGQGFNNYASMSGMGSYSLAGGYSLGGGGMQIQQNNHIYTNEAAGSINDRLVSQLASVEAYEGSF